MNASDAFVAFASSRKIPLLFGKKLVIAGIHLRNGAGRG